MLLEKITSALIDVEALPWVPVAPYKNKVFVKAIKVDPVSGEWITLLKTAADIELPRHHHSGAVYVYTISGQWKYKEHDWVAKAGSFVSETAGSQHTPIGVGTEEVITLNIVQGDWNIVDDAGHVLVTENWRTVQQRYLDYCKANDIKPVDIAGSTASS